MSFVEVFANHRARQWLPGILNGGVLLLLTASMAQWTWLLAKPSAPPAVIAPPTVPASKPFSIQSLLAAHLFGEVTQPASDGRIDNLPVSSLNLVLTGVIASDNGGYALISVNGQAEESYAVGQSVTSGAVLQGVYPDRAVIQRNGVLESLMLAEVGASPTAPSAPPPIAYRAPTAPGTVVQEVATNRYKVERDQLTAQMRTPDFLRQAIMRPFAGGGFLISQIQPGSLYEKLGLRVGDVIKGFNGQPVNTAEDAMRLYQQMTTLASVQMEVMRGGKSEIIYYQF